MKGKNMNMTAIGLAFTAALALGACETYDTLTMGSDGASAKIRALEDLAVEKGIKLFCNQDSDLVVRFVERHEQIEWSDVANMCPDTYGKMDFVAPVVE
ncbi:MAG: hypothetical protein ACXABY_34620 [Candidatus Thorarchaeota archaeon]|jgi:hypothetical protein